jgi:hypothetical protein
MLNENTIMLSRNKILEFTELSVRTKHFSSNHIFIETIHTIKFGI